MSKPPRNSNWTRQKLIEIVSRRNLFELKILQTYKNIDFNIFDDNGYTLLQKCLFQCSQANDFHLFRYLLKQNADPLVADKNFHRDTIGWIICLKLVDELRFILKSFNGFVNFHAADIEGNTYLHRCVISGNLDMVNMIGNQMHKLDLDMNIPNNDGLSANMMGYYLGYLDITNVLETRFQAIRYRLDEINHRTKTNILWQGLEKKKQERNKRIAEQINRNKILGLSETNLKLPEIILKDLEENKIIIESSGWDCFRNWKFVLQKPVTPMEFSSTEFGAERFLGPYMNIYSKQMLPCFLRDHIYDRRSVEAYQNLFYKLTGEKMKKKSKKFSLRK